MRSYAQNFEDVRLARVLTGATGFYIDIGAAGPTGDSVTKHFYDRGWHGINVEPDVGLFARLQTERPRDINLNVACTASDGTVTLYETGDADGWSTASLPAAEYLRARKDRKLVERSVQGLSLGTICRTYASQQHIDFLKIDAEGYEQSVLQGADWAAWLPDIVVVEATEPHRRTASHDRWEEMLLKAGLEFAVFDGLNRFYVPEARRSWITVLAEPVSPFDGWELDRYLVRIEGLTNALSEAARREELLQQEVKRQTEMLGRSIPVPPSLVRLGQPAIRAWRRLTG